MEAGITFFGAVDRKDKRADGSILSTEPAWAMEQSINDLKEEITGIDGRLRRGEVPSNEVENARSEMKKLKSRHDEIVGSKPKLCAKDKDELAAFRTDLAEKISVSLPTHDAIHKKLVDPRREMNFQKTPCIKVDTGLAKSMGIEPNSKGQVSRDEAVMMWKIASKCLGEDSYSEALRMEK